MEVVRTRSTVKKCPLLGAPYEIPDTMLPTIKDVLCHILYIENQMINQPRPCFNTVALRVEEIWLKASIPSISHQRVLFYIRKHYNSRRLILKTCQSSAAETLAFNVKKTDFIDSCNSLMDITACKCKDFTCCNCPKERKVKHNLIFL